MRILIIADVHANAAALEILPDAEVVICAGDVVTYGSEPRLVVDLLRGRGVRCVRGDEDNAVANGTPHAVPPPLARSAIETRAWTNAVLSEDQLRWLSGLPPELEFENRWGRVAATHAYPGDYERYLGPNPEELERIARAYPRASTIVLGHTHRQGLWHVGGTTIVMPGSLGQGERAGHASYAFIERGRLTLHTVPYDVDRAVFALDHMPWSAQTRTECVAALKYGTSRPRQRLGAMSIAHAAAGENPHSAGPAKNER